MKPLLQKLPLTDDKSFVAKTFRTPHFEVGWHRHAEFELILFTEGHGTSFVGNHVGQFNTGDIYFLGKELPHTFQKHDPDLITSAIVVQFTMDFWGEDFLQLPENKLLNALLDRSSLGLKINGPAVQQLIPLIQLMEQATGLMRIAKLCECLDIIAKNNYNQILSSDPMAVGKNNDDGKIDRVFAYTVERFREQINLSDVAAVACMSVPAFCNFFKRSTKKTYVDVINELRVGHACSLLRETNKPVVDIGYESGYNTLANFHKQFFKLKKTTPLQYRKEFEAQELRPQANTGIINAD